MRRASLKVSQALQTKMNLSQKEMCSICAFDFQNGQKIVNLNCNPHMPHKIHDWCYDELIGYFKENAACPLCRVKIDQDKVQKVTI